MTNVQHQGAVGAVSDLGGKVVAALPASFLGLLCINVVFLGGLAWYADHERADRVAMFNRLMDACVVTIERAGR